MADKVDVLAVFDKVRETAEAHAHRYMDGKVRVQNIIEARAAVAELIEAAEVVASMLEGPQDRLGRLRTNPNNPLTALRQKLGCGPAESYLDGSAQVLRAALARVQP